MRVFISDCEGPISKNDNAFETMKRFVPRGDRVFAVTSRYDDVLADIVKKPGYKAGDTLKLILPFLRAYDVTDQDLMNFSGENIVLIPNIKDSIRHIAKIASAYIVSTSYEHYLRALCRTIEFPFDNVYCTRLELDKYVLSPEEKAELKEISQEIAEMQVFEVPAETKDFGELPEHVLKTVGRLDELFWQRIAQARMGRIYSLVSPVGGSEKAEAVRDVVNRHRLTLSDVMYVGDSITDVEALQLVKEHGGLAVSFNGNRYAVMNSEVTLMAEEATVTAIIAEAFIRLGRNEALDLVAHWSSETLVDSPVDNALIDRFLKLHPRELPKVKITSEENMENLMKESSSFRRKIRGEVVGRLG